MLRKLRIPAVEVLDRASPGRVAGARCEMTTAVKDPFAVFLDALYP